MMKPSLFILFTILLCFQTVLAENGYYAGQGILTGQLTEKSAMVQVRLTSGESLVDGDLPGKDGIVEFQLATRDLKDSKEYSKQFALANAGNDHIARIRWENLEANTEYICYTRMGKDKKSLQKGPSLTFKTLQGDTDNQPAKFVVVTGLCYGKFHGDPNIDEAMRKKHLFRNKTELPEPYQGPDRHLGYPGLKTMLNMKPNFFISTGDTVYYDFPNIGAATTRPTMRKKYHEQFVQQRFKDFFAEVPTYWQVDDHDYRIDNGDNTGDHEPSVELAQSVFLEQFPFGLKGEKNVKTYGTYKVNKDLQIWILEGRFYRTANEGPDGPEKTIWGKEQREWLKKSLSESTATFKVMVTPTPMLGPDGSWKIDNHTSVGGFNYERDEFFNWVKKSGLNNDGFYIVCGDRHWQYHAINPLGIEEFSCGSLIDTNSRLGYLPGGADTTDPEGHIKQLYSQNPASGGFLMVEVNPAEEDKTAELSFTFYDEHGIILHKVQKHGNAVKGGKPHLP